LSSTATTLPAADIAAAIPDDTVLVEYCFAGDLFMGWAVDRSGVRESFETHADTRAIARLIREYHGACAGGRPVDEAARNLSERFLAPVTAALRGSIRIIFVPFGAAHTLPFHALPFEGLPLAARFQVSYLPSASTLRFLKPGHWSCPREMFAIGNPTGDLPHAETEAVYVARLFGAAPLLRDDATEAVVRNRIAETGLVHLATHGSLDADSPLASSISLADGELTLYELMGIHLHADLVVLSACETGTGDTTPGDDVFGLSRGLLAAGARSAIVSLWPVEDLATSLLMGAFYRNLQAGHAPSAALQMAQEFVRTLSAADVNNEIARLEEQLEPARGGTIASLIHEQRSARLGRPLTGARTAQYSHPYYWAPFVLVG
jgi:CHAT domain-containing protein